MRKYNVVVNSKIYKVEVKEGYSHLEVKVNDKVYEVKIDEIIEPKLYVHKEAEPVLMQTSKDIEEIMPIQSKDIICPMAGLVSKILVKVGDEVKVGQPVLILEAMKMANEIVAHLNGRVKEIKVKEGDNVNNKQLLIVIE
ncbi:MAG TPA: biotin/lipoyl-binding protein [bacterium]|nr:biotin/lipoyl-binding protein [bacterium]HOL48351.1 biotin/lipoyl-binding protein [bacterium]HPQ19831.1 biotin/lipoyl-binding protein [bacterium]